MTNPAEKKILLPEEQLIDMQNIIRRQERELIYERTENTEGGTMNLLEEMFLNGMAIWVPDGDDRSLEEMLNTPLDVIYMTREQTEREQQ